MHKCAVLLGGWINFFFFTVLIVISSFINFKLFAIIVDLSSFFAFSQRILVWFINLSGKSDFCFICYIEMSRIAAEKHCKLFEI